jgi:hypothetical protein
MQTNMYHEVRPCNVAPPHLQLYTSSHNDSAQDSQLAGFVTSALEAMTTTTMLWRQHPRDAASSRSQAAARDVVDGGKGADGHAHTDHLKCDVVLQTRFSCVEMCAAPVGCYSVRVGYIPQRTTGQWAACSFCCVRLACLHAIPSRVPSRVPHMCDSLVLLLRRR